jgi:hypothetical protein
VVAVLILPAAFSPKSEPAVGSNWKRIGDDPFIETNCATVFAVKDGWVRVSDAHITAVFDGHISYGTEDMTIDEFLHEYEPVKGGK